MYSGLSHLKCSKCNKVYSANERQQTCQCGAPLLAQYDLDAIRTALSKEQIRTREASFWRYHELLPVTTPDNVVSLGEVMTPLVRLDGLGKEMGIPKLLVKNEGVLPSGTFKARGAAVGVAKAKELGVQVLGIPTNGNAGAAWALYGARAGISVSVVMPKYAPEPARKETVFAGARLFTVDGTIADAGRLVTQAAQKYGWYEVSTLKEPYRLEGKKTMGIELAEQFGWSVPDVIVYPTGGGAGVIGIYKALKELQEMTWIGPKLPRIVVVQVSGCAPLVKAFNAGKTVSEPWDDPHTVAVGMSVPKALGDFLILDAVAKTSGTVISVTDEELLREQSQIGIREGLHVCPEGAAAMAGARKLREAGWIREKETVVVFNTGSGLKYTYQQKNSGQPIDAGGSLPDMPVRVLK
ncbi:threonine synthase [Alicyclobacillus sp. SO9]|nr:threonine synthase [Alicyclobacillus sp. SO9]QQE79312.1 threonine synthase [Alicyclobacillus sp. SO9]